VVRRAQDAAADSLAWFTDYNSHNIASRLVAMDVPAEEAVEAGNVVQAYVMAKTARRRIRNYLRNRDSLWLSDVNNDDVEGADGGEFVVRRSATYRLTSFYEERSPDLGKDCSIEGVVNVMSGKGLTGRDIAAVFMHTPSVSMARIGDGGDGVGGMEGETLEDTLDRAYSDILLGSLKLRKYDARKVLRSCPGLLTKRGSKAAEEVMAILSSLNVTPNSLSRDKASIPTLLSRSPAAIFRLIAFLSGDGVRMPVDKIGSFIRRSQCVALLNRVAPLPQQGMNGAGSNQVGSNDLYVLHTLLNNVEDGSDAEIEKTYRSMYKVATFLRDEVGIRDVGKLMMNNPDILITDIENRIIPLFDFLCDDVGIDEDDVPRLIEEFPTILLTELKDMKKVVEYLLSLNVSAESLPSIFQSFPSILTLDIKTRMMPVVEFLRSIGVTNLGRFITRLPPVMGYSVENELAPKWKFLTHVCEYARFEVVRFPAYFSYPLHKVIMNRYTYLRVIKGIPLKMIRTLSVDQILRFGDDDFSRCVARDSNGELYREYVKSRRNNQMKRKGKKKVNHTTSKRRRENVVESNEWQP